MRRQESIERLFAAAVSGRTREMLDWLAAFLPPDQEASPPFYGLRLIHETAGSGHVDTLAALIACGADAGQHDATGNTPLSITSSLGLWLPSLVLLAAGAKARLPTGRVATSTPNSARTELTRLIKQIHTTRTRLRVGAKASRPPDSFMTGLAPRPTLAELVETRDALSLIRHEHFPAHPQEAQGLFRALCDGATAELLKLCESLRLLHAVTGGGDTLAHVGACCSHGHEWCVHAEALAVALACGSPCGAANLAGETCLHVSAFLGRRYPTLLLLAAGADPLATDNAGLTPSDYAKLRGFEDLSTLITGVGRARACFRQSAEISHASSTTASA
ncbi:MAG: hypothetical protein ACJ74Q_15570 [Pyrinomonadaceae bacterium]